MSYQAGTLALEWTLHHTLPVLHIFQIILIEGRGRGT